MSRSGRGGRGGPRTPLSAPVVIASVAVLIALAPVAALFLGSSAPGWAHLWCSPAAVARAEHEGRDVAGVVIAALRVHWPHFVPALIGLGTLVYLRRADVRHRRHVGDSRVEVLGSRGAG